MKTVTVTIPQPDDWHLHLRSGDLLATVLAPTAKNFGRAIVMPNLKPPVTNRHLAAEYRQEILAACPANSAFVPLMTCYLTDNTDPDDLITGGDQGIFTAAKLYPAGATTNSDAGVTDINALDHVFAAMAEAGLPLLVHGEVVGHEIDVFDREAVFLTEVLTPLRRRHPRLRVVLEHITTRQAVDYVLDAPAEQLSATITPHHLVLNRNAMFDGGLRPHAYCLPVIKREQHRQALVAAACSGDRHFFLGTDSAPHPRHDKESDCGCAGIYNAPSAMASYLEVFHNADSLPHFAAFAATNGAEFYRLPINSNEVTYSRQESRQSPETIDSAVGELVVFEPPFGIRWIAETES